MKKSIVIFLTLFLLGVSAQAQRLTDTPLPVILPQITQVPPTSILLNTPTPTLTATPEGPKVLLKATNSPLDINVRDYPDVVQGVYLGFLDLGVEYEVTGIYFSWYQFRFPDSPTGIGWVYNESVDIIGDISLIPFVDPNTIPTPENDPTLEAQLRLLTPDVANTATAEARLIVIPTNELLDANQQFQPTFTPPADIVQRLPTQAFFENVTATPEADIFNAAFNRITAGEIPPILPIVVLGILGVLGLFISSIRK